MISFEEFYSNPLNHFNPAYRPVFEFLRKVQGYHTKSLAKTENPRLRRAMEKRYKLFSDQYDYKPMDRGYIKYSFLMKDIAEGIIKVKNKRHISKLFNQIDQNQV